MRVTRTCRARPLGLLVVSSLLTLGAAACGDECQDADGDGRGAGCEAGPDCDDADPTRHVSCDGPATDCDATPYAAGCPCLSGERRDCFEGDDPDAAELGVCRPGRQMCITGVWTACQDQILPTVEQCNDQDDDCDGLVDEGAQSPCGGCNPQCTGGVWGTTARPFEASAPELDLTRAGELTLARDELESVTVWVPNTGEGTLSKVDAERAVELARYDSGGAHPERVAVDFHGDAWVLNPSASGPSTLTKVAGERASCVDVAGDGLQTSTGGADVLPAGADDCVLLTLPVGDGAVARSLSVDGTRAPDRPLGGHVWLGMAQSEELLQLDGETGALLRTVPIAGVEPFASAFDPWGTLWVLDRAGVLARVDPAVDPPTVEVIEAQLSCYELEAIASGADGRLTLSGFACENVIRYDPVADRWEDVETEGVLGTRGVAVVGDDSWVAHTSGALSRVRNDPLRFIDTYSLADDDVSPLESIAVAADSLGQLWVVSSMGGPAGTGVLTRFDPETEAVTAQVPVGVSPRGLGDLSGTQRLGEFVPEGVASHVFEGCTEGPPTEWQRLHLAWAAGEGASVVVELRHAATLEGLEDAEYERLAELPAEPPPYDLELDDGGVVEVRLTLAVEGRLGAPRIARVGLEWRCPGPD